MLAAQPTEHWIQLLNREGIPSGPILTIEEMFKHPQTAAREMLLRPLVGEHTDEILIIGHSFYLERNG